MLFISGKDGHLVLKVFKRSIKIRWHPILPFRTTKCRDFFSSLAGAKVSITGPVGTSHGTSIVSRRSAGIVTVCVRVIKEKPFLLLFRQNTCFCQMRVISMTSAHFLFFWIKNQINILKIHSISSLPKQGSLLAEFKLFYPLGCLLIFTLSPYYTIIEK